MAHCFHEYKQNRLKQKIKLEARFVKNSYIALLYIDYHIIAIYIIDLFIYIYIYIYIYVYIVKKGECKKIINILTTSFE